MSIRSVLNTSVIWAVVLLLAAVPCGAESEKDSPTISLVQTIEVKEFEGYKFNTSEYIVQRGDSLAHVLKQKGVIGRGPMPVQIMRMIKALNPDLKNPFMQGLRAPIYRMTRFPAASVEWLGAVK